MKLLSLFSGIGAFEKALQRLGINYELVGFSEIDKYAVKSYCAIHNVPESMNLGDITKIDEQALPKNIDLVTYGFPCQDISLAGKQKGLFNEDGTQTRSGLFFEALRIIEATQPRVAIAENVKNLTSKKFNAQFQIVLESLEQAGYNNYWQILNAKDYGIPQNRERVFIVSIRKDIDTGLFKFPQGFPLELRLKDMLEDEVDEKFYINTKRMEIIKQNLGNVFEKNFIIGSSQKNAFVGDGNICPAITSAMVAGGGQTPMVKHMEAGIQMLGLLDIKGNEQVRRVYGIDGIAPTLNTMQGGHRQPKVAVETEKVIKVCNVNPSGSGMNGTVVDEEGLARTITIEKGEGQKILVREATKQGYAEAYEGDSVNLEHPNSKTRRGRVGHGVAQTLTTSPQQGVVTAAAMRGRYNENGQVEQQIEISDRDYANAITTVQKDSLIAEPNVLTPKRTEYGKAIRKAYESGEIKESRHNMTELHPRTDGIANTLTTVLKDNYVAEPSFVNGDICKTVRAGGHESTDRHSWDMVQCNNTLRIRKLSPKECFRLMDFDDSDFEKAEAVNSNTQLYKQAGNSIVVSCAEKITEKLLESGALRKEKEMELRIEKITFPEVIDFNFEELKQEITNRVAMYANMVYTEDQVKQAKADRANLNKFVKALSDERIKVKKQCLKPYEEFEAKVNELSKIVQEPIKMIDQQVKEYEEQKKRDKLDEITKLFNSTDRPEWLHIAQIMNEKWLNASVSMKSIQEEIISRCEQIENDIATLSNLPEFGFEATEVYKTTLDINKALNEGRRLSEIQKRKAEHEAEQARLKAEAEAKISEVAEVAHNLGTASYGEVMESAKALENQFKAPAKQWVSFSALLTTEDALALKAFFESRNIDFKAI